MKDVFGKEAASIRDKQLFLFDMDGTIYEEDKLFDGTIALLNAIKANGGRYVFITNNSSKGLEDYVDKVNRLGIEANKDHFFTSTQATAQLLKKEYPGKLVYCQGTKSMIRELTDAGIKVTEEVRDDVDVILVGFDTELTSEKLRKTSILLGRNLPYYATNCDLRCPVSFGYIPDCGSICQMLENATGRKPIFIGKPEPTMINVAMEIFGVSKEETAVVGDRLYTDIASGLNAGVTSICVLTGEATVEDINNGDIKPTFTFESVRNIADILAMKKQ